MARVMQQVVTEGPQRLVVMLGDTGQTEGGKSVLVRGVRRAQYGTARSFLHPLQLSLLDDAEGARPGWGGVHQLGQYKGCIYCLQIVCWRPE